MRIIDDLRKAGWAFRYITVRSYSKVGEDFSEYVEMAGPESETGYRMAQIHPTSDPDVYQVRVWETSYGEDWCDETVTLGSDEVISYIDSYFGKPEEV